LSKNVFKINYSEMLITSDRITLNDAYNDNNNIINVNDCQPHSIINEMSYNPIDDSISVNHEGELLTAPRDVIINAIREYNNRTIFHELDNILKKNNDE
tara:strand:+ start:813 stop:1109 length:297 start_codon:yes stop_codon:yes gene_type:complete